MKRNSSMMLTVAILGLSVLPASAKINNNQKDNINYSLDVQTDKTLKMNHVMLAPQRKLQTQHIAAQNAQEGRNFLAMNQEKPGIKTTASGLQYKILKRGQGTSPTSQDTVTVNYQGELLNGTVFDSSYKRGKPVTFPVAGVIQGWQEALSMMKPGGVWMLYIPANLAYGVRGVPGAIAPNETLIFKIQLISVKQ